MHRTQQRKGTTNAGRIRAAPGLRKQDSFALVEQIKKQVRAVRKRFLVATLDTARWRDPRLAAAEEAEVSNELVDSRSNFLGFCQQQHWQFNELSRAHYTTMMLLARLGGLEEHEHGGLANSC